MNLTQIYYFNEVANTEHYTKAADNLHVSQPALSRTIRDFEKELGIKLFEKKGRNVSLSKYGEAVKSHVETILSEIKSIPIEINDIKEITNNTVTILVNSSSSQMQKLLVDFQRLYKNINVVVSQLDKIEYTLKNNNFDLIIHSETDYKPTQNSFNLLEEHLMVAIPKNHKLAKKNSIDLIDISNESLISLSKNKDLREINEYYCNLAGYIPKYSFENNSPAVIKDYINTGLGFAIFPSKTWKDIVTNDKIKVLKIHNPNCKRYIILEWKKKGYVSKTSQILKEYIIKNFQKYI